MEKDGQGCGAFQGRAWRAWATRGGRPPTRLDDLAAVHLSTLLDVGA